MTLLNVNGRIMKAFLGRRLEDVVEKKEVETEGRTILVTGPLSEAFTKALNESLRKDTNEVTPVVESFTDPRVLAKMFIDEAVTNAKATVNPISVYAFDKKAINDGVIVNAAIAAATAPDLDDFYVIADYTDNPVTPPATEYMTHSKAVILNSALEAIVIKMGGHYIDNNYALKAVFESRVVDK